MKNASTSPSLSTAIIGFARTSSVKPSDPTLSLTLLLLLALAFALPSHAQRIFTMPTVPRYTAPVPVYHPAPQISQQRQTQVQQQQQQKAQVQQQRQTQVQQQQQQKAQVQQQRETQKQQQQQQKAQAQQQKEAQKQQQQQQKVQASQQKELLKQQQKQQKEQARQQQEQQKQLAKQQKDQARPQRESQQTAEKTNPSAPASSFKDTTHSSSWAPAASGISGKNASVASVLTPRKSQATIQKFNSARTNMSGINGKPLPSGQVTLHANGGMTLTSAGGREYGVRPNGTVASYRDGEKAVSFDSRGKVSSIHTANLDINHSTQGRSIVGRREDGVKVVNTGRHSGYAERTTVLNNRSYTQRTIIVNQHAYISTFVVNRHGGIVVASFVPPVFFAPRFYGWAYYPWAAPIAFNWGWYGAAWYGGPSPYFVASPMYPSAAFWLTDYVIGQTLATAYELHNDAAAFNANGGQGDAAGPEMSFDGNSDVSSDPQQTVHADATTPISPEIKAQIAEEVKRVLADDNAEAANPGQETFDVLPAALQSPNHVFVLSTDLSVTTADQQVCALQAGDMLQVASPASADSSSVQLRVASSKRLDCPTGILVNVSLPDIQEMQNNFQAQVESGLAKVQEGHGIAGLPALPPQAAAPPRPAIDGLPSLTAADASAMLDQQKQQADQVVTQAEAAAF
jgi:hypothetical protein